MAWNMTVTLESEGLPMTEIINLGRTVTVDDLDRHWDVELSGMTNEEYDEHEKTIRVIENTATKKKWITTWPNWDVVKCEAVWV